MYDQSRIFKQKLAFLYRLKVKMNSILHAYDLHILDIDVFEDLAIVHIPDSLVVPDLGGE